MAQYPDAWGKYEEQFVDILFFWVEVEVNLFVITGANAANIIAITIKLMLISTKEKAGVELQQSLESLESLELL